MNRLLGKGKTDDADDEVANEYNECVAEVKKEQPYIGPVALHQEVMKRLGERKAAKQEDNQNDNTKEDFTPQRIAFRRKPRSKNNTPNTSPNQSLSRSFNQSLSRSFIGFLSSSTNTQKTSNRSGVGNNNNVVMPGRRTSTYNEDDGVHPAMHAIRDIELSDSAEGEDEMSQEKSNSYRRRRSSLSSKLSSMKGIPLKGKMRKRYSAYRRRRSSSNSSISSAQRYNSSDVSKDSTIQNSDGLKSDDDEKPRHKPPLHNNAKDSEKKDEEEIMDFVEKFLAKGGSVKEAEKLTKTLSRRSSLHSVEENKELVASGESVTKSITSLGEGNSTVVAADGSLICGWGRDSLNESELMGANGEDLICNWDSRVSFLSNSSATAASASDTTPERKKKLPLEINVGVNSDNK